MKYLFMIAFVLVCTTSHASQDCDKVVRGTVTAIGYGTGFFSNDVWERINLAKELGLVTETMMRDRELEVRFVSEKAFRLVDLTFRGDSHFLLIGPYCY